MRHRKLAGYVGVGAVCAAAGVAGGIAQSSGAPSQRAAHPAARRAGLGLRRVVHADAVVAARGGRFATVTIDRGTLRSLSGDQLTLDEGTPRATYRTITLTVPANAVVRNNGAPASLSSLTSGERVAVRHGPLRTRVTAFDSAHRP